MANDAVDSATAGAFQSPEIAEFLCQLLCVIAMLKPVSEIHLQPPSNESNDEESTEEECVEDHSTEYNTVISNESDVFQTRKRSLFYNTTFTTRCLCNQFCCEI